MTEIPEIPETEPEQTELVTEITLTTFPEQETFTTTECQTFQVTELDVDQINNFAYLGSAFIIACLFWFVCKSVYRLFNMFF